MRVSHALAASDSTLREQAVIPAAALVRESRDTDVETHESTDLSAGSTERQKSPPAEIAATRDHSPPFPLSKPSSSSSFSAASAPLVAPRQLVRVSLREAHRSAGKRGSTPQRTGHPAPQKERAPDEREFPTVTLPP